MAQWGEDDGPCLQRDRPVVTTEAAQPGQSLRPRSRLAISVVSTSQLADRVHQHRPEHSHPVSGAAARPGQVHDQGSSRNAGDASAQHRRRHTMISAVPSDRRRELRNLPLDHAPGLLGGVVSGLSPVPPVVITTAWPTAIASRSAAPTASPSGTTTGPATSNPRSSRAAAMIGPDLSS